MTPYARIFKRALQEKLAFVPMGAQGPQASGPGGAPMGPPGAPPGAPPGGAPMDPSMGGAPPGMPPPPGGAPMDPSMGGIPPMPPGDPSAGGAPPMDPSMGGAPPMDPSMGGMPPMDPSMMAPPGGDSGSLTEGGVDIVDKVTKRTMDIVRQTLEMVGKAKPPKAEGAEAAPPPTPAQLPGPVTGMTGFDPSSIQGPLKTAGILGKALKK